MQPGCGKAGVKSSLSLNPQAQLLSRTRLPPAEPGDGVLPTPPEQGRLLCSPGWPGKGLPGFQCLPSAATSLCPARGCPLEELAAPCLPACSWLLSPPRQPALSQRFCQWREPAMHGGSRSAVKAASLLGRGRAPAWPGSRELPAASDLG